ncbi:NQR2, RnfD, RnfE family [Fictibacillus enclensis]|uniref:Uncharacterized protein n=1 Tax=Fictibacillus enclensis TaxID=1017270 RepID=A0A0V8J8K0_9BACL|nr:RnfABCDGE type electron transport complex subunit D [Fictibacillus enclensis]KSU83160.1 hypothetical protein AS030_11280 [Fictibacillus enclensis]SCC11060.1 NQR2, RnfD, RnfE family [Fictibacillus enclensis]
MNYNTLPEQGKSRMDRKKMAPPSNVKTKSAPAKKTAAFFKKPKGYLLYLLLVLSITGSIHSHPFQGLGSIAAAVLAAVAVDMIFSLRQKRKTISWDGAVITGLIIALVLSEASPLYVSAAASAAAIVSKNLLSFKRKPLFNPAAFGLLFAAIPFHSGQSWWGAMATLPVWFIPLVLIGGYLITSKVNKFPQVFSFLGIYFILLLVLSLMGTGDVTDALRPPFIQSVLFLAFFMVTDPPTSPAKYKDQVLFGGIAAVISLADYVLFGGLSFLLVGVLAANVWKAWNANKKEFSSYLQNLRQTSYSRPARRKHFP